MQISEVANSSGPSPGTHFSTSHKLSYRCLFHALAHEIHPCEKFTLAKRTVSSSYLFPFPPAPCVPPSGPGATPLEATQTHKPTDCSAAQAQATSAPDTPLPHKCPGPDTLICTYPPTTYFHDLPLTRREYRPIFQILQA